MYILRVESTCAMHHKVIKYIPLASLAVLESLSKKKFPKDFGRSFGYNQETASLSWFWSDLTCVVFSLPLFPTQGPHFGLAIGWV
mmetsp:Transcript_17676/g.21662  ORF Transcript_17676/g.21662 Transcript_17676/m.21662 type:complete len:85 (+) Transcript_17676:1387-1641(+)